jgi:Domain of unknown function (DUF4411)
VAPPLMSDSTAGLLYSIDSSSLMDWQARFYPVDVFSGLVGRMDGLMAAGRLVAPALVREEIEKVGTTGLKAWATTNSAIFVPTKDVLQQAQSIQGLFPDLLDPKAEFEEADAYVIALARMRDGIVVTQETTAAEKRSPRRTHYLPDVCRDLGIPCINLLGMMRREGWQF